MDRATNRRAASHLRMTVRRLGLSALGLIVGCGLMLSFGAVSANALTIGTAQIATGSTALYGVACPTPTTCVTGGYSLSGPAGVIVDVTNASTGALGSTDSAGSGVQWHGVACSAANTCQAVGTAGAGTGAWDSIANGIPGPSMPFAPAANLGIACPGSTCEWVGQNAANVGTVYNEEGPGLVPVAGTSFLEGIACWAPGSCLAVGENAADVGVVVPIAGGVPGTAQAIAGTHNLEAIACASPTACVATGNSAATKGVVLPIAGGVPGSVITVTGATDLPGVTCFGGACLAVGSSGPTGVALPLAANGSLGTLQSVSGTTKLFGVACATNVSCVAVGQYQAPSNALSGVVVPLTLPHGYWLVGSDGGIFSFGNANFHGSVPGQLQPGQKLNQPVVGITPTVDDGGYWMVAADGGIFSFGDTQFYGSIPGMGLGAAGSNSPKRLNAPIVGMVPSVDDGGYFLVASDGGVFAFGDATFAGSCPGQPGGCSGAGVAVMPDASGKGYWLVTITGHVYSFGDASYLGAPGPQGSPVTSAVRTPDGGGYWILLANGAVYGYGDAIAYGGPTSSVSAGNPAHAIFADSDGQGYWVASANGTVFPYGDAPNDGSYTGTPLNGPIIAATGF